MLPNVVVKVFHDTWRPLLIWSIVSGLLAGFYLALYPSIGAVEEMRNLLESMPPALRAMFAAEGVDISTPAGYLNVELFTFVLPLVVFAVAVTLGSSATAGEEERGTLELLLANPIARWRVVLEKALATAFASGFVVIVVFVSLVTTAAISDIDLRLDRVAAALISVWLLGIAVAGVAMLVGALTGSRMLSMGIAFAVGVLGFFVNALAPLVDLLDDWRWASPHYHYLGYDPLTNGLDLAHAVVLLAIAVTTVALAMIAFERRDLRT